MRCNHHFSFPRRCSESLSGAWRDSREHQEWESCSEYWEELKGKSPAWENGNVKDVLDSKGGPCHCRYERKSSDLKTFSSVSVSSTSRHGTSSSDVFSLCSCHSCFRSCIPTAFGAILNLWNFSHVSLSFTKLNMLFLTLLTSCKCSVFHFPALLCTQARFSLSALTLRRQTRPVTPFFVYICWNIPPDTSKDIICLSLPDISGCSHSDHTVLDHLLLIISYIISQTITNPQIPDLSSQTFCLPSHFNYSDSQGHLVLSDLYSHSSLRCQNFQLCVLGDFSLRILLSLPRSSTGRKDQFPNCSVRKSFGKFPPESCTSPYSLLILLSFSFTNNFPHGTYQIPDWSLDKGDQQHFLCLENQVSYQNKAIMFVWHNLHFVNPCSILSHFPFISAYLIVLPFEIHFEISNQG